ncbi:hypothetical protein [Leptolyngbya iicbica]|uniref:Uncharacterized protein n=2 Tax=Cyanophyceae TaxID=3028117 RepID=A0A4Q7EGT0_9CYAN|nr:hypothetical protein [Leptolyngbya sp. LK]RZM82821.1 hypothetical protein DYY88_06335 [Leptolyngbya sp. LK]
MASQSSNRAPKAGNRLIGQFDLPIDQLSIFTILLSGLVTGGSYSTLIWGDRLTALLPAYTEWPLFFTTLRLVVASVAG